MKTNREKHWEKVYQTKSPEQVSWTQTVPKTSLEFILSSGLSPKAKIIDVGGGDSNLVDFLLDKGFENITVLDISAKALEKAKRRLGKKAEKINWVVSDVLDFKPECCYDLWHDRATFHFLNEEQDVTQYMDIVRKAVGEYLVLATFSEEGPEKCSGLTVHRYSEEQLHSVLSNDFNKIRCVKEDHVTPSKSVQNFLFCSFRKN